MAKEKKEDQNRTAHGKRVMLEALESTRSIVTPALKKAGVSRTRYYQWLKEDPDFAAEVEEITNIALDFVEEKAYELIDGVTVESEFKDKDGEPIVYKRAPDAKMIQFFLETKGKKRGFIKSTHTDITTKGEQIKQEGNVVLKIKKNVNLD